MSHVSRKLSGSIEGALAGGGEAVAKTWEDLRTRLQVVALTEGETETK